MLEALIVRWGYLAVGIGVFFEGETILVIAGALAHRGLLSFPLVVATAFAGSMSGDQLWFYLGRYCGKRLLERRPRWDAAVGATQRRLDRYGVAFVLAFRFIYGMRTITPVALGMSDFPAVRFAILNVIGAALWAIGIAALGWGLGAAAGTMLQRAAHVEELVVAACAVAVAVWLVQRRLQRRSTHASEGGEREPESTAQ
jgi:membrane protein DedA with SNARE-associated domain